MNHCGTQKLETDRQILRRFEIGDACYYALIKSER